MSVQNDYSTFDDPGLKDAVHRIYSPERAPRRLRSKIMLALDRDQAMVIPFTRQQHPMAYRVAAAAVFLVGLGYLTSVAIGVLPDTSSAVATTQAPGTIRMPMKENWVAELMARHDECAADMAHMQLPDVSKDDQVAITTALQKELGGSVAAISLGSKWEFEGAHIDTVMGSPAAHLIFAHDGQTVSVFNVPMQLPMAPTAQLPRQYGSTMGHEMVVEIGDMGVIAVVGSSFPPGKLTSADMDQILDSAATQTYHFTVEYRLANSKPLH